MSKWKKIWREVTGAEEPQQTSSVKSGNEQALEEGLLYMMAEVGRSHDLETPQAIKRINDFWQLEFGRELPPQWEAMRKQHTISGAMPLFTIPKISLIAVSLGPKTAGGLTIVIGILSI